GDALASTLVLSAQTKIACSLARVAASCSSYGNDHNSIRSSRSASGNGLAGETSQGLGHSDRRVEWGYIALPHGAYSRRGAHRLARRSSRSADPRLYFAGKICAALQPARNYPGHDLYFLR